MNICFIADLRSPIAANWISHFVRGGHEVHLISTHPCDGFPGAASTWALAGIPWKVRRLRSPESLDGIPQRELSRLRGGQLWNWAVHLRQLVRPAKVLSHTAGVRRILAAIRPDLVHAMRIPFEGILAGAAVRGCPLIVSAWGNDFTLHASGHAATGALTRKALNRCSALHSDCARDRSLSREWGFDPNKPTFLAPGNGGIRTDIFSPLGERSAFAPSDPDVPVVINPRGFRSYVRNDCFFQAIPLILKQAPRTVFLCPAMKGSSAAQHWVDRLGIGHSVRLLPSVAPGAMASLFRAAQVSVSPSIHDGTPNSLLEAMACGCLPVVGAIESMREWIDDGVNGILCDANDPVSIAQAVIRGLSDGALRERARLHNSLLIRERAEYLSTMSRVEEFYSSVLRSSAAGSV